MSPRDLVARIGRLRSRSRDERGQGVLELSIILPVVLLLLTGMVEFGLAYNDLLTVGYATREGSRAGAALAGTTVGVGIAVGADPGHDAEHPAHYGTGAISGGSLWVLYNHDFGQKNPPGPTIFDHSGRSATSAEAGSRG